jgi:hypothetical protein
LEEEINWQKISCRTTGCFFIKLMRKIPMSSGLSLIGCIYSIHIYGWCVIEYIYSHPVIASNNSDLQCKTFKAEARRWLIWIGPNAVLVLKMPWFGGCSPAWASSTCCISKEMQGWQKKTHKIVATPHKIVLPELGFYFPYWKWTLFHLWTSQIGKNSAEDAKANTK